MFEAVLDFARMPISQQAPSMCFGALFRAYPILILREEAAAWMDGVFRGHDEATQARLLTVIYDFLNSEAEKKTSKEGVGKGKSSKAVKQEGRGMDALIGNAAELSESG
jgi:cohesin loading factor subunit SCC2